jgi:hypothetical protein
MTFADRKKVLTKVETYIQGQLRSQDAINELRSLGPRGYDWNPRVNEGIAILLPRLVEIAPVLVEECLKPFNSPIELRNYLQHELFDKAVARIADKDAQEARSYKALLEKCRELGTKSCGTVPNLESQQISAEVKRFLLSKQGLDGLIRETGGSIYPDLVLAGLDYSFLPFQKRDIPVSGPCLKNPKSPIPSNVPDGCEIKTNQGRRIKVDAHGAHPGLHIGITWDFREDRIAIYDLWIAYIRVKDYSISDGRVDVTTKKRSFRHDPFISLLRGEK